MYEYLKTHMYTLNHTHVFANTVNHLMVADKLFLFSQPEFHSNNSKGGQNETLFCYKFL